MSAVDLGAMNQQPPVITAFVVIINPDGSAVAKNDLTPPQVGRPATIADMRRACMEIVADIAASQTADVFMQKMAIAAQQTASQQQAQQILTDLNRRKQ